MIELLKYGISGVINTAVGYGVFWILFTQLQVSAEWANAFGYAVALVVAFILNKVFVFNNATFHQRMILRFIVAFLLSFIINQIILIALHRGLSIRAEFAQVVAMASYTVVFYLLNKRFVFSARPIAEKP